MEKFDAHRDEETFPSRGTCPFLVIEIVKKKKKTQYEVSCVSRR